MAVKSTTLGEVIRNRRLELGISQRALASSISGAVNPYCSPQTMNNIEHDDRLGEQYWQSLSDKLGIPMEVFIYYGMLAHVNMMPSIDYPYDVIQNAFKAMEQVLDDYTDGK